MILAFRTQTLRTVCEDDVRAMSKLGSNAAAALRQRLADLRAAVVITDLPTGQPIVGSYPGDILTFALADDVRMVWKANQPKSPQYNDDGTVNWARITRIQLLNFEGPE